MLTKGLTEEPPEISAESLELCLASDDLLIHHFNEFLNLQTFPVPLKYNKKNNVFEMDTDVKQSTCEKIKADLLQLESQPYAASSSFNLTDNSYKVLYMDGKLGIQWVAKERLPAFLKSDCYFEYKLAKLMSQSESPDQDQQAVQRDKLKQLTLPRKLLKELERIGDSEEERMGKILEKVAAFVVQQVVNCAISEVERELPMEDTEGDDVEEEDFEKNKAFVMNEFKGFLRGTLGEKLFFFWMDTERLKTLKCLNCKKSLLIQMKSHYLLSGGLFVLRVELLSKLGLSSTLCWTEEKLSDAQPEITHLLLSYWYLRFLSARESCSMAQIKAWRQTQLLQPLGILFINHPIMQPSSSAPYLTTKVMQAEAQQRDSEYPDKTTSRDAPSRADSILSLDFIPRVRFPSVDLDLKDIAGRMENLLQALYCEPRSGYVFTRFCESSGNQLWENAVHFWSDLQRYHQLFNLDGLDCFRLQQQAQFLYSTYLCSIASLSIGVSTECMNQIYNRLNPPFEELFDNAEEHALRVLLEPWNLLVSEEWEKFKKVDLQEQICYVDSVHYRKLKTLQQELLTKKRTSAQERRSSRGSLKDGDLWKNVPEQFRGYRLQSLMRNPEELKNFQNFLDDKAVSDLTCWMDIEKHRRSIGGKRDELNISIKNKYLNRKFFFGTGSPADKDQQDEVLQMAGGWSRLQTERVSDTVLNEVQDIVWDRLEKQWMPLFLSSEGFIKRQKKEGPEKELLHQLKMRETWKTADKTWVATPKELIEFRRALKNPVICEQFQRFLSLKGQSLEKGLLFWLEVQKYKDLYHSRMDASVIQNKVNIIINLYINSSIPPALQIDIPQEQAKSILERRREMGPYVFREAQNTVLGQLFKFWPEFQTFRKSMPEDKILSTLETMKQEQKLQHQKKKYEEEEEIRKALEQEESWKLDPNEALLGESMSYEDSAVVSWSYSVYVAALEREQMLVNMYKQSKKKRVLSSNTGTHTGNSTLGASTRSFFQSQNTSATPVSQSSGTGYK